MCAWTMSKATCTVCGKPTVGSTMKTAANTCASCLGVICRNHFSGLPKSTCGVPFACNRCLEKLPAETKEKFKRKMHGMVVGLYVMIIIGLALAFTGLIIVMSVAYTFANYTLGFSAVLSTLYIGLGIAFGGIPFVCIGMGMQFGMRAKARKVFGIKK